MDLDLAGYLFDLLDSEERGRTEAALRADPAARARLDRLRANLVPLAAACTDDPPPAGLADRTLALVAAHSGRRRAVPSNRSALGDREPAFSPSRWRRIDVFVASSVLILFGGLGLSGVGRLQQWHDRFVCQNSQRQLHAALVNYSLDHGGRFPQVTDRPPNNVAGAFLPMLQEAGYLAPAGSAACPAATAVAGGPDAGGYAYSLGFRGPEGHLHGLRRDAGQDTDRLPILADRAAPASHRTGHNVLYIGGNVRFCTTPKVGVDGDDIFLNQLDAIAAGLHPLDTVLGAGDTSP
ncbi:MAG TPA: hypothetical protein VGF55_29430 [Gemmataceae bacterium]|jgi:hypothetical protein